MSMWVCTAKISIDRYKRKTRIMWLIRSYDVLCDLRYDRFFSSIECKQTRSLTLTWLVSLNSRFMSSRLSLETVATVHRQNSSTITWFFFFNSSPGFPRKQRLHADDGENSLSKRNYNRSRSFRMILLLYMRCRKLHVYVVKQKLFLFCLSASSALIDRCMHKFKQLSKNKKRRNVYLRSGINAGSDTYDIYINWSLIWLDQLFILKVDITSQVKAEIQLISCDICS